MYGSFAHGTFLLTALAHLAFCLSRPSSPAAFPDPLGRRSLLVTRLSPRFRYYPAVRLLPEHLLPISLALIGSLTPVPPEDPGQSSWGHALIFRTVPSANTLVRWVNENAFAPIVRARPCPTFGRPVHPRGSPHRLRPGTSPHALRIPPRGGHPALRSSCERWLQVRLGCLRLSPSCPFRLLHTFLSLRPARHYPRLWIRRSSSERRRDFNPPDQGAAQRTLWRGPTSRVRASSASAPRLPDADRRTHTARDDGGQTRDLPGSDAIPLHVMWP